MREDALARVEILRKPLASCPEDSSGHSGAWTALGDALEDAFAVTHELPYLDEAIHAHRNALGPARDRQHQALELNNLGNALRNRYLETKDVRDLDEAVELFEKAIQAAAPGDEDLPGYVYNLGNGWKDRYLFEGGGDEALDRAIEAYERAVTTVPAGSPYLSLFLNGLAVGYRERFLRRGNEEDLDRALDTLNRVIEATPAGSEHRADYITHLGTVLDNRYEIHGRLEDLEKAIETHELAAIEAPESSPARLAALNNLGNALRHLYLRRRRRDLIDRAVDCFEKALEDTPESSPWRPSRLNNLANALRNRAQIESHDPADLDRAIEAYRQAVTGFPPDVPDNATLLNNLGNALETRFDERHAAEDLEEAIDTFRRAIAATAELSAPERPGRLTNLANALRLRFELDSRETDLEEARHCFREAVQRGLEIHLEAALIAGRSWGRWALQREAWHEAAEACLMALEAGNRLFHGQLDRGAKETWLREYQSVAGEGAYALARQGEPARAAEVLERGLARLLRESLEIDPSDTEQHEGPLLTETVIYLVATQVGGLALRSLPGEATRIVPTWLPGLSVAALIHQLERYALPDTDALGSGRWYELTRWLWEHAMVDLTNLLSGESLERAILVPAGMLALLPWHATWVEDPSFQGGRRFALDELTLSYAPNVSYLGAARHKSGAAQRVETLAAVANPQPVSADSLDDALIEVDEIAAFFQAERRELLFEEQATKERLLDILPGARYVHLSCHAVFDSQEPLKSHFLLAHDEKLTLGEILELDLLKEARLITLSACDSALKEAGLLPDEAIGLFGGFLEAGVPGVIGTLGNVEEMASTLLMWAFYRFHLEGDPITWRITNLCGTGPREPCRVALWTRRPCTRQFLVSKPPGRWSGWSSNPPTRWSKSTSNLARTAGRAQIAG